jgi:hypothetical protein
LKIEKPIIAVVVVVVVVNMLSQALSWCFSIGSKTAQSQGLKLQAVVFPLYGVPSQHQIQILLRYFIPNPSAVKWDFTAMH